MGPSRRHPLPRKIAKDQKWQDFAKSHETNHQRRDVQGAGDNRRFEHTRRHQRTQPVERVQGCGLAAGPEMEAVVKLKLVNSTEYFCIDQISRKNHTTTII